MILHRIRSRTKSKGPSALMLPIGVADRHANLCHLIVQHNELGRNEQAGFGVLGYIGFITGDMYIVEEDTQFFNKWVINHWLSDIISNAGTFILTAGVRKKQDFVSDNFFWRDVIKFATVCTPNSMEFGFYNHQFQRLPNTPAIYLFSAVSSNMLWNDAETFVNFLVRQGLDRDIDRLLIGDNGVAEIQNERS